MFDSEEYPQYMVYDDETQTISPMTAENCDTTARYRQTFFEALRRFWKAVIALIRRQIESKRSAA